MSRTMTYYATIRHHSIARAPEIEFDAETRPLAKQIATRRFAGGFVDHEIVLMNCIREPIAKRRIGDRKWTTLD